VHKYFYYAFIFDFNTDLNPEDPSSSDAKKTKIEDRIDGKTRIPCILILNTISFSLNNTAAIPINFAY